MKRTVIDCPQRSAEWFKARLGIPTASSFANLITPAGATVKGAKRETYRAQLLYERLCQQACPHYVTPAMQRGIDLEPQAAALYEMERGVELGRPGFVRLDGDGWACGCSPDGLVGSDGGLEVKCPLGTTLIDMLLCDGPPAEYIVQVQASLWITGRAWWDLLLYTDAAGLPKRTYRIEPDAKLHSAFAEIVPAFCTELDAAEARLVAMGGGHGNVMAGAAESFAEAFG